MKASKASMTDIAAALRRQAGRPVEDHTDLEGSFDLQIEWAPEETRTPSPRRSSPFSRNNSASNYSQLKA